MKLSANISFLFGEVPLLLFAFAQHDSSGGSIFPGVWSAMLAARSLGVGSALTSVMAFRGDEVLEILAAWGAAGGPEDVDGDGTVGFGDVLLVLANWGACA